MYLLIQEVSICFELIDRFLQSFKKPFDCYGECRKAAHDDANNRLWCQAAGSVKHILNEQRVARNTVI